MIRNIKLTRRKMVRGVIICSLDKMIGTDLFSLLNTNEMTKLNCSRRPINFVWYSRYLVRHACLLQSVNFVNASCIGPFDQIRYIFCSYHIKVPFIGGNSQASLVNFGVFLHLTNFSIASLKHDMHSYDVVDQSQTMYFLGSLLL